MFVQLSHHANYQRRFAPMGFMIVGMFNHHVSLFSVSFRHRAAMPDIKGCKTLRHCHHASAFQHVPWLLKLLVMALLMARFGIAGISYNFAYVVLLSMLGALTSQGAVTPTMRFAGDT